MLTSIQFYLTKSKVRALIVDLSKDLSVKFPSVNFHIDDLVYDEQSEGTHRFVVGFDTCNDHVVVKEVRFSSILYTQRSLKMISDMDSSIKRDFSILEKFLSKPHVIGTELPQFQYFTYTG